MRIADCSANLCYRGVAGAFCRPNNLNLPDSSVILSPSEAPCAECFLCLAFGHNRISSLQHPKVPTTRAKFKSPLLPLDRPRRLTRDVINDAVDTLHLV